MEKKIQRAIYCLYAVVAVEIYTIANVIYWQLQMMENSDLMRQAGYQTQSLAFAGLLMPAVALIAAVKLIPQLRLKTTIGWVGSLAVFLVAGSGYALPASIFGIICLLDKDVRTHFLAELDIKL